MLIKLFNITYILMYYNTSLLQIPLHVLSALYFRIQSADICITDTKSDLFLSEAKH